MNTYPHGLQVTDRDGHTWIIWAGPDHDGHYAATPHTNDGHQGFEWLHTEDINPPEPPAA